VHALRGRLPRHRHPAKNGGHFHIVFFSDR
jgi:hypothetical protein